MMNGKQVDAARADGRYRRRNYVINPSFQWKYTGWVAVTVFLVSSSVGVMLFGMLHQQARAMVINPHASHLWENTRLIVGTSVIFSAVTAAAIAIWSMVATHRICGPLHVLDAQLNELARGRFPTLRSLRKKDEFKKLHETFGEAVESLRRRKKAELSTLTKVQELIHTLNAADDETSKNMVTQITTRIEGLRSQAADALGEKLDNPRPALTDGSKTTAPSVRPLAQTSA